MWPTEEVFRICVVRGKYHREELLAADLFNSSANCIN